MCEIWTATKEDDIYGQWAIKINTGLTVRLTEKMLNTKPNMLEVAKVYKRIMWRLKSYCKSGIFVPSINNKIIPTELLEDDEILKKVEFNMNFDKITFEKHKFLDGFKRCLVFRIESPLILQDTCRKSL